MFSHDQNILFIFPGQGSQYVGMGSDFYEDHAIARDIYAEASEVLMEHYGTPKAALLESQSESANERRLRVGREHLAMLKASF